MAKTKLDLPALDSPIVREPELVIRPFDGVPDPNAHIPGFPNRAAHRIHVRRKEGNWEWAHLLRMVSGWDVVSAGMLDGGLYKDAEAAGGYVRTQYLGQDGDGFDKLSHEAFRQQGTSPIAHIHREGTPDEFYCGTSGGQPAVFDMSQPDHVEQHCNACDRTYRAEHYGRTPTTAR